jgi:hypothetical protein
MTPEEIAAHNRKCLPSLAELMAEVRKQFPQAKLIHGVDHTTQCEVGQPGAERAPKHLMVARRCDESERR